MIKTYSFLYWIDFRFNYSKYSIFQYKKKINIDLLENQWKFKQLGQIFIAKIHHSLYINHLSKETSLAEEL